MGYVRQVAEAESLISSLGGGSNPSLVTVGIPNYARLVKLVKALGSDPRDFVGSTPTLGTQFNIVEWPSI
jgi:hypothetical protein